MKTHLTLSLAILLGTTALVSTSCKKERWPYCVRANGKMTTETRTVDQFTQIELNGSGDVYLYQVGSDSEENIEIEASSNVMDRIETEVKNGRLEIKTKCINGRSDMKFTIKVKDLSKVSISGSGSVTTKDHFNVDDLELNISGSGEMNFDATATDITCNISGSGDLDLNGSTNILDATISGSGNVKAFDMPTTDCIIQVSGSGNCEVYVNGRLDVDISGSGSVVYDGTPTEFNSSTSGSGSVSKR